MGSLDNVRLKLKWAEKQFETLNNEILSYLHKNPAKFMPERYSPTKEQVWGKFVCDPPVPPEFALLFGDTLLCVQSCLDYLIWELVESAGEEKPSISNQFPIIDSRVLFEEEIGRKRLRGVPFWAIAIIEKLQPYHATKGVYDSPLHALKTLANIYKHRYLPLTALTARKAPPDIEIIEIDGKSYADAADIVGAPFDLETEFGPFRIVGNDVHMEGNFAVVIALSDTSYKGREVSSFLAWICTAVSSYVLPEFERFFE